MTENSSVEEVMRKLRDYVKGLNTNSNDTSNSNINISEAFNIDELQRNREENNINWNVRSEFPIRSNKKYIGKIIKFYKKFFRKSLRWYINPIVEQQNMFNRSITKSVNEICNVIQATNQRFNNIERENEHLKSELRRLEKKLSDKSIKVDKKESTVQQDYKVNYDYDFDYFLFENRFRGMESEIKNRQKAYIEYFLSAGEVLDIGCGRGEFLELMLENGIKAKGIDINDDFIQHCVEKGLDVEKIDAVEFLKSLQDNSLGGVFISQVVEHLQFTELNNLIELCFDKMKKNSYIIIETPNPKTLAIFMNSFYLDPTHVKPVHPEMLSFLISSAGFKDSELKLPEYSKDCRKIPELVSQNIDNLSDFNSGIRLLNDALFGYQDYAIIAKK